MSCQGKVSLTCGGKQYAKCVKYEGILGDASELDDCADIEETTQELYSFVDDINTKLDLSTLTSSCITYTTPKIPLSVLQAQNDYICTLHNTIVAMQVNIATMQQQIIDLQTSNCN